MIQDLDMIGRLSLAALCGGLIGLERERHGQAAGLRTHMVVAIGAALIMVVSIENARTVPGTDPGRIAAQVVSGIGFLGAGAILRYGMSVKGLTTAACLWTAAGIGLACGMGYWQGGAAATVIVLVTVFLFEKIERRFVVSRKAKQMIVRAKDTPGLIGRVEGVLHRRGIDVKQVGIHKELADQTVELTFLTDSPAGANFEILTKEIGALEDVESIDIN